MVGKKFPWEELKIWSWKKCPVCPKTICLEDNVALDKQICLAFILKPSEIKGNPRTATYLAYHPTFLLGKNLQSKFHPLLQQLHEFILSATGEGDFCPVFHHGVAAVFPQHFFYKIKVDEVRHMHPEKLLARQDVLKLASCLRGSNGLRGWAGRGQWCSCGNRDGDFGRHQKKAAGKIGQQLKRLSARLEEFGYKIGKKSRSRPRALAVPFNSPA